MSRLSWKSTSHNMRHEAIGHRLLTTRKELYKVIGRKDADIVGGIISSEAGEAYPVLTNLLCSTLDADRLDYLTRDASMAGVKYGHIDLDYLRQQITTAGNPPRICLRAKARHVAEHYLLGRWFHYLQVISHRACVAFESMARVVIYHLARQGLFPGNGTALLASLSDDRYLGFTDDLFWWALTTTSLPKPYDTMRQRLLFRIRPESLYMKRCLGERSGSQPAEITSALRVARKAIFCGDTLGLEPEHIGFHLFRCTLESIAATYTPEEYSKLPADDVRQALRIMGDADEPELLVSNRDSPIHHLANQVSYRLAVFYLDPNPTVSLEVRRNRRDDFRHRFQKLLSDQSTE